MNLDHIARDELKTCLDHLKLRTHNSTQSLIKLVTNYEELEDAARELAHSSILQIRQMKSMIIEDIHIHSEIEERHPPENSYTRLHCEITYRVCGG